MNRLLDAHRGVHLAARPGSLRYTVPHEDERGDDDAPLTYEEVRSVAPGFHGDTAARMCTTLRTPTRRAVAWRP
jgi:hypothetical protein